MAVAAEQYTHQQINYQERVRNDTETWCAEVLHGSMRTPFRFEYDGAELYAEDGGALGEVFSDAIISAHQIVEASPNLLFELRRRLIEHDEYDALLAMASGKLPNTMVVISDFPPELMEATEDVGGYNAARQQTMMRIFCREADGSISMKTQSLDRSNRRALEAIYGSLGALPEAGELLGQRINLELPEPWQENLANKLTATYDASLSEQYGGDWHAGLRQTSERKIVDTYEFACAQDDLITWFAEAKLNDPAGAEELRYQLAATISERYEKQFKNSDVAHANTMTHDVGGRVLEHQAAREYLNFQDEMVRATRTATQAGRVFSGCGASAGPSVSPNGELSDALSESGYGNKTDSETKYSFNKKMYCVVCQAPPKKEEGKKSCGPCGICRSCDKQLSTK